MCRDGERETRGSSGHLHPAQTSRKSPFLEVTNKMKKKEREREKHCMFQGIPPPRFRNYRKKG